MLKKIVDLRQNDVSFESLMQVSNFCINTGKLDLRQALKCFYKELCPSLTLTNNTNATATKKPCRSLNYYALEVFATSERSRNFQFQ